MLLWVPVDATAHLCAVLSAPLDILFREPLDCANITFPRVLRSCTPVQCETGAARDSSL